MADLAEALHDLEDELSELRNELDGVIKDANADGHIDDEERAEIRELEEIIAITREEMSAVRTAIERSEAEQAEAAALAAEAEARQAGVAREAEEIAEAKEAYEELDEDQQVDAIWDTDALLAADPVDLVKTVDAMDDLQKLRAILKVLDGLGAETDAQKAAKTQSTAAVTSRIVELEELEQLHAEAIALVGKIRKTKGTKLEPGDEAALHRLVGKLPRDRLRLLEKEVATWPKAGAGRKMNAVLEIITGYDRGTDEEEAERGHFTADEGAAIKDALSDRAEEFGDNECLKFLYEAAIEDIFSDEEEEIDEAKRDYAAGVKERKKKTSYNAKTLSRVASDIRTKGLLGPINTLQWVGGADDGHYEPPAGDVIARLSNGDDGWYFFLCSMMSFHTFVIAVEKSGGNRKFFEIQGGQTLKVSQKEISTRFDTKFLPNNEKASSRIWQAYAKAVQ